MGRKTGMTVPGFRLEIVDLISDRSKQIEIVGLDGIRAGRKEVVRCGNWRIKVSKDW